jgi:sugar/nucleoside kinase (ribokinase family)
MTGAAIPNDSIRGLAKVAGRDGVLVRLGRDGCLLLMRGRDIQQLPAPSLEVADTTGAGDAHTGTFMAALAVGASPLDAVRRANLAAATAVSKRA